MLIIHFQERMDWKNIIYAEDIYITRNGKTVAKLSNPYQDRVDFEQTFYFVSFAVYYFFRLPKRNICLFTFYIKESHCSLHSTVA